MKRSPGECCNDKATGMMNLRLETRIYLLDHKCDSGLWLCARCIMDIRPINFNEGNLFSILLEALNHTRERERGWGGSKHIYDNVEKKKRERNLLPNKFVRELIHLSETITIY